MSTIGILVVLIATTALAALGDWAFTRADITDPAVLAGMNPQDLRDAEVDTALHHCLTRGVPRDATIGARSSSRMVTEW